jgi:glucose-6-phosphate isomerase
MLKNTLHSETTLTQCAEWQKLIQLQKQIATEHLRDLFHQDPDRFKHYSLTVGDLLLDYSRNLINPEILHTLISLAQDLDLSAKTAALFNADLINTTEKRAVLHHALRDFSGKPIKVQDQDLQPQIEACKKRLQALVDNVLQGKLSGATGKPIRHIVNIGIGGSHLGPMMATHALAKFNVSKLSFHFIASVDAAQMADILPQLDPASTLVIISSKTFTTIETLTNANSMRQWMQAQVGPTVVAKQFIAVTAAPEKAQSYGINPENIFPMWDFIGGRYSLWSAIGLPLQLMLGNAQFNEFLHGAYEMDVHFQTAPYQQNMPVILALLGIWYRNFFAAQVQALIPYSHRLRYLIPYLQQADMESNGKNVNLSGQALPYATGPVLFGEEGCSGQHAYHQLLLQGQHFIPIDFILLGNAENDIHQQVLLASGLAQAQALMRGKTYQEAYAELIAKQYSASEARALAPHRVIPGNRPSNILFIKRLTPKNLGALIALYEHKIFVQGALWNINSFDQWGVELGKQLLPAILSQLQGQSSQADSETRGLIDAMLSAGK